MAARTLQGSCHCGRNRYIIEVPPSASLSNETEVFFDNSTTSRLTMGSPLTAWLRVPLPWYHSATIAYFPDETHATIRRTYECLTSPASTTRPVPTQRHFCGYCSSLFSSWNERTPRHADLIEVALGSLGPADVETLVSEGILESDVEEGNDAGRGQAGRGAEAIAKGVQTDVSAADASAAVTASSTEHNLGSPWFEEMVGSSAIGRFRRRMGGYAETEGDQAVRVEWEVVEIGDGVDGAAGGANKRKFDDGAEQGAEAQDVRMT